MVTNSVSSLFYFNILWKEFKGLMNCFFPQIIDHYASRVYREVSFHFIKELLGKNALSDFLAFCYDDLGSCQWYFSKFVLTYKWRIPSLSPDYRTIGCYKDTSNRAIPTLEGADAILDGSYSSRKNPIAKCAVAAMRRGYSMFAVQNGGWCAASATAPQTFDKYGKSSSCRSDGEGGGWANQVYLISTK